MFFRKFLQRRKEKKAKRVKMSKFAFYNKLRLKIAIACERIKDEYFKTISRQEVKERAFDCFKDEYDGYDNIAERIDGAVFEYRLYRFIYAQTDWLKIRTDYLNAIETLKAENNSVNEKEKE